MSLDLGGIKTAIKTIFDTANTTSASPVDLSSGLNIRIQQVLRINPSRIPIQASFYPFITMYFDAKEISLQGMAKDQLNAKRMSEISLKIAGAMWEDNVTNNLYDEADDQCEKLMESIEQVLRANPTLGDTVTWAYPTNVTYHNVALEEDSHLRVGVMNLKMNIYY